MQFSTPLLTYQDGDTYVAAQVDGDSLILGETRNEEAAAEGKFALRTVIPLQEALAIAKAVLAAQEAQAEYEFWLEREIDRQYDAWRDKQDLRYDAESDFERPYVPGSVVLEAADYIPF